jgi:hypothetical protein
MTGEDVPMAGEDAPVPGEDRSMAGDHAPMTPDDGSKTAAPGDDAPLPEAVIARAVELTHYARRGDDGARTDRDDLLADHGYTARVRTDDATAVLVLHPAEWTDGPLDPDAVDPAAAVEVPLDGGDYDAVDRFNRRVVARVRDRHGPPHAETAAALADYMGNHHATRIDAAGADHLTTFREEYLPRNAWPSDAQLDAVAESVRLTVAAAEELAESGEQLHADAAEPGETVAGSGNGVSGTPESADSPTGPDDGVSGTPEPADSPDQPDDRPSRDESE